MIRDQRVQTDLIALSILGGSKALMVQGVVGSTASLKRSGRLTRYSALG
jgi:hypothetical protein